MNFYTKKQRQGFTLVEALVAISILLLVIIGPMTIAQKGIQNSYFASEQLTAVFLAQEAIEGINKLRDDKALEAFDSFGSVDTWEWYDDLDPDCTNDTGCAYNVEDDRFEVCANNCELKIDSDDGRYNYKPGGVNSGFTRKVFVDATSDGGVPVSVEVSWNTQVFGGGSRTITIQTWVYDQYRSFGI